MENRNLFILALLVLILGLQVLFAVGTISHFIPLNMESVARYIGGGHDAGIRPEREFLLYRIFIVATIALQGLALLFCRKKLNLKEPSSFLIHITIWESALFLIMFFALFKIVLYSSLPVFKTLFYITLTITCLSKLFWHEIDQSFRWFLHWLTHLSFSRNLTIAVDIFIPLFIILYLYIPDWTGVVAKVFKNDLFWHLNPFLMGPGWAYLKGGFPHVDVESQYGVGAPIVVAELTQLMGGFSFANAVGVMIILSIGYFLMLYAFFRVWFKNVTFAVIAILLAIKFLMFSHGGDYFYWRTPNGAPIRFLFDVFVLLSILFHIRTKRREFLWLAAIFIGLMTSYVTDFGLALLATYYAYLGILFLIPSPYREERLTLSNFLAIGTLFLLPVLSTAFFLYLFVGKHIFNPVFWTNINEYFSVTKDGYDAAPMYFPLKAGHPLAFFRGCLIPLVYLYTLLRLGTLFILGKMKREDLFVIVTCVYGLVLYHYYIYRSIPTSHFVVSLPFVMIICYWMRYVADAMTSEKMRRLTLLGFLLIAFCANAVSHAVIQYPSLIKNSGHIFDQEKQWVRTNRYHTQDVSLIQRLTGPDEKVALISSWEIDTLMAADRRPFFYYFNLIFSTSSRTLQFGGFRAFERKRMDKIMDQLHSNRPPYVFIERRIYFRQIDPAYYQQLHLLKEIMAFLDSQYTAVEEGYFLVALMRNDLLKN